MMAIICRGNFFFFFVSLLHCLCVPVCVGVLSVTLATAKVSLVINLSNSKKLAWYGTMPTHDHSDHGLIGIQLSGCL